LSLVFVLGAVRLYGEHAQTTKTQKQNKNKTKMLWTRKDAQKKSPIGGMLPEYSYRARTNLTDALGNRLLFPGVFASCAIPAHAYIAEYRGRRITWQQANAIAQTAAGTYVFNYTDPRTNMILFAVDAADETKSSWARLVNSPITEASQNVTWEFFQNRIYYKTTRDIAADEELLIFYGSDTGEIISHAHVEITDWDAIDAAEAAARATQKRVRVPRKVSLSPLHTKKPRSKSKSKSPSRKLKKELKPKPKP
jgi:hypothetical protein